MKNTSILISKPLISPKSWEIIRVRWSALKENGKIKSLNDLKTNFGLDEENKFEHMQIPKPWKTNIHNFSENIDNPIIQNHYLIKSHQIYCVNGLNSTKSTNCGK